MSARCGLAALATLVRRSTGSLAPSAGAAGNDLCQTSTAVLYGVARLSTSASSGSIDRKDVLFNLDNGADPEAAAAIRAYQREAFAAAAKPGTAAAAAEPALPLTERVQRKYAAAAIVETGIQSVSLPLSWDADGTDSASVKRYVAQLSAVGAAAGFAAPAAELDARLTEAAAGVDSAKELLLRMRPYTTPDFHAGLMDALAATEAETGAAVSLDGTSPGYRKFADKVKALAQTHKLPWQMLLPVKQKLSTADEATADKLSKDYTTWLQSAAVADAKAELEDIKAEATRLLDSQLAKSAEAVRKEAAAAEAAIKRRLDAAQGAPWAEAYKRDLAYTAWFDDAVAADPKTGPKAATA